MISDRLFNRIGSDNFVKRFYSGVEFYLVILILTTSGCSSRLTTLDQDQLPSQSQYPLPRSTQQAEAKYIESSHICDQPQHYANRVVGDGHCVSLIKACSNAPNTKRWRPGPKVIDNQLIPGTIIATFKGKRYPNKSGWHAAIFSYQDRNGIWAWDQWQGKPVGLRLIRFNTPQGTPPANRASSYRVVLSD